MKIIKRATREVADPRRFKTIEVPPPVPTCSVSESSATTRANDLRIFSITVSFEHYSSSFSRAGLSGHDPFDQ